MTRDGVAEIAPNVAAVLAAFEGVSLSLLSLRHVSPTALAALMANTSIALPKTWRDPAPA